MTITKEMLAELREYCEGWLYPSDTERGFLELINAYEALQRQLEEALKLNADREAYYGSIRGENERLTAEVRRLAVEVRK